MDGYSYLTHERVEIVLNLLDDNGVVWLKSENV